MAAINRNERLGYLFIESAYHLVGEGITDWTFAANPKTTSKQYVHQKNASGGVAGYAPTIALNGEVFAEDKVNEYLTELGRTLDIGAKSHAKFCIVDLWTSQDSGATAKAVEYKVSISVDNPGSGPAGETLATSYTLNVEGDGVIGKFTLASKQFAKDEL